MALCYTLVQKPTNRLYSINHGNGTPRVIAFTDKCAARSFMRWVTVDEDEKRQASAQLLAQRNGKWWPKQLVIRYQRIEVDAQKTDNLLRRCQLNGLDFLLVGTECECRTHEASTVDMEDLVFHLENTFQYY